MQELHESEEFALRTRIGEYVAAYNRGDAKGAAAIYTEDGSHTYALGFTHRGRPTIESGLREMLGGPMRGTQIQVTPERIRFIGDGIAIEEASFILSGLKTPMGREMDAVSGLCLGVYQKEGQLWFAAAVQCLVPPPAPSM